VNIHDTGCAVKSRNGCYSWKIMTTMIFQGIPERRYQGGIHGTLTLVSN
jgi:hypothetical protein